MNTPDVWRPFLASLAELLEYPNAHTLAAAEAVAAGLDDGHHDLAVALGCFVADAQSESLSWLETIYTRTFDLAPVVAPYLSVHLWGEESFQRSQLMTGLSGAYAAAGVSPGRELPDHVAVILRCGPALPSDEWQELLRFVALPGLRIVLTTLGGAQTPYRHVVEAAFLALAEAAGLTREQAAALPSPHRPTLPNKAVAVPPQECAHA
jgi:nitrate reductase assembly molybdenum cofactor insertion protein NarJ